MGLFDGTELERPVLCDRCQQDLRSCNCPPVDIEPKDQILSIRLEKRKKGKLVTVVSGFLCQVTQLQATLTFLKNHCGAGGTIADQHLEIQGDHSERIAELLKSRGYRIR